MLLSLLLAVALADEPELVIPVLEPVAAPLPPADTEWTPRTKARIFDHLSTLTDRCSRYFGPSRKDTLSVRFTIESGRVHDATVMWRTEGMSEELATCAVDTIERWRFNKKTNETGRTKFKMYVTPG